VSYTGSLGCEELRGILEHAALGIIHGLDQKTSLPWHDFTHEVMDDLPRRKSHNALRIHSMVRDKNKLVTQTIPAKKKNSS
jgi:hypothetical protein